MASSASPSTNTPKITMFKAKSGFVIPKNKLSGSLVPTFRGGKKPDGNDSTTNDSSKQMQRKTRWAPDLSQDSAVRRGRAMAYQTRVDQITQQLKSGSLTNQDEEKSTSTSNVADDGVLTNQTQNQKLQELEFEKREVISEILKLNPSYKAPPDYKPILKEATVPIPVKERPGYNFVGLVLGSERENQKRLEKETGARVQVYGTKFETKEKVQVMASDGNEALSFYDELFVQITAKTYDKVDAAVALIELLLASVLGKPAVSSSPVSGPGDDVNSLSKGQDLATSPAVSTSIQSQGLLQPVLGPMLTSQGQLPQYTGAWFQSNPSGMSSLPVGPISSSTVLSSPNYPSFSANPSTMPVMFAPRPAPAAAFGSGPQNMPIMGQRAQPPPQGLQRPFMLPNHPLGQTNLHGNTSIAAPQTLPPQPNNSALSSFPSLQQPRALGPPLGPGPLSSPLPHSVFNIPSGHLHDRPMPPAVSSAGWVSSPGGASSQSLGRPSVVNVPPPMVSSAAPASGPLPGTHIRVQHAGSSASVPSRPFHGNAFAPSQVRPPSAMQGQPFAAQPTMLNSPPNPQFGLTPPSSQLGVSGVGPRSLPQPRFSPGAMGVSAPRPPQPSSGDFTFQPHRPNGQPSHTVTGPSSQGFSSSLMRPPPPPQGPSFQPPMQNPAPRQLMQNFPRPQVSNTMGHRPPISPGPIGGHPRHFGPSNMNPQMGPGNMNPANQSQMANTGGSFPPRLGMQSYSVASFTAGSGRSASNPSGAQQVYDPFSPTSAANAPQMQGGNPANVQKQENDPEYEDLMASVGVK